MTALTLFLTWAVVVLGFATLLRGLRQPRKTSLDVVFAVFSGSLAMLMLKSLSRDDSGWLTIVLAFGACATCNVYWLLSRLLFRGEAGVGRLHVAIAAAIAALIVGYNVATGLTGGGAPAPLTAVLGELLTLSSSTVLLLAFVEALRGWSAQLPMIERRLRLGFMLVYGGCVLLGAVGGGLAGFASEQQTWRDLIVAASALSILLFTHVAIQVRARHPWPAPEPLPAVTPAAAATVSADEHRLAAAIVHQLQVLEVYRESELKVADLARRLGSSEHRVSRAISHLLDARNFNQLVNRYRIEQATRALADPDNEQSILTISLDCGFASIGPFNRAFKAQVGCTPSEFRASQRTRMAASL